MSATLDITRLGSTLDTFGKGLVMTDLEGQMQYANDSISEMTGYSSGELIGENPKKLQSGRTPKSTYAKMWNAIGSGAQWRGAIENRSKKGKRYWEDITVVPLLDSRGANARYIALIEPIQEHTAHTVSVEKQVIEETMEMYSVGIAHELNNALMGILGNCSLAEQQMADQGKLKHRLQAINGLAKRLSNFTQQLSICTGSPSRIQDRINLNELIIDVLDEIERERALANLDCDLSLEPLFVIGDRAALALAIRSIVINALDATQSPDRPALSSQVSVRLRGCLERNSSQELALIEVSDHGPGMEETHAEYAPRPFFTTKSSHLGLGLSTAYGVARSMNGKCEISSSIGKGTTVQMTLPLGSIYRTN